MLKTNILKLLYKRSPMDFYTFTDDGQTIIKSTNNTSLGYKFNKKFTQDEIFSVWEKIKLHKRISTIMIFLLFLVLMYVIIFPKYTLIVNNNWYVNLIIILAISIICFQIAIAFNTIFFEKSLKKDYGEFSKSNFKPSGEIDESFYKLFKTELSKAIIIILVVITCFCAISPFKLTHKLIKNKRYKEAINITTIGSKIFPIAQEWYSLRGYARFKIGDFKGAINDYDKAYTLGADGFNIMNFDNKIYIKYYIGEYDSAIKDFDTEINKADSDFEKDSFLWDKAQFLYNIKHYEEALALYTELLVKAENDQIFLLKDRLYLERAQVYQKLGLNDLAEQDLLNSGTYEQDKKPLNEIPKPVLIIDEIIK